MILSTKIVKLSYPTKHREKPLCLCTPLYVQHMLETICGPIFNYKAVFLHDCKRNTTHHVANCFVSGAQGYPSLLFAGDGYPNPVLVEGVPLSWGSLSLDWVTYLQERTCNQRPGKNLGLGYLPEETHTCKNITSCHTT